MKYSAKFNRNFRHIKDIDEVILPYNAEGGDLAIFVPETFNKSQRIIVSLPTNENVILAGIPGIQKLRNDGWNIAIRLSRWAYEHTDIPTDIPFFFEEYPRNLEEIYADAESGVSDIYITESLGFCMKAVKAIKERYEVQIRVIPNIAQCSPTARTLISPMKKFWIRPEDTELYEGYIDVFELAGGIDDSRLSVVYEIYKQQQWMGNLNDLILDFGEDTEVYPNLGMSPHFAEMRFNCGKGCLVGSCNLCDELGHLAQSFSSVGIEIVKKRKVEPKTEEQKQEIIDRLRRAEDGSGPDEETVHPE